MRSTSPGWVGSDQRQPTTASVAQPFWLAATTSAAVTIPLSSASP